MIPYDVKTEIKKLVTNDLKSELSDFMAIINELKEEVRQLKIEIDILKEGGNI